MKGAEHISLIDFEKGGNGSSTLSKYLIVVTALLVLCTGCAIAILPFSLSLSDKLKSRVETPVDAIIHSIINESLDVFLPTRFSINESFILPPSNQMGRATCWIFATIFQLESQYRANGIRKGFLADDEYVLFSKQAYGSYILQQCARDSSSGVCRHGGPAKNSTDDHLIPTLYYLIKAFPNLTHSILPEAVCEYIGTDDSATDIKCDGMWEAISQNPLEFNITHMEVARDIRSSKRLLVKSQRPLGMSFPIADFVYYAPCDNSNYSKLAQCDSEHAVSCPDTYTSKLCAKINIESRNMADGTFAFIDDVTRIEIPGAHEINMVGYNDDWVYKNRKISSKSLPTQKGGFIAHNSWRGNGHSVDYYMGRRSEENEAVICPNHNLSSSWIPTTYECIASNNGDITKCGKEFERVRGKGMTKHADKLGCKNKDYCDPDRYYALQQRPGSSEVWAEPLFSGFDQTHLVSWKKDGTDFRNETVDFFPFYALYTMLYPIDYVANDPDNCGYWIIPYKTVEMVNTKAWDLLDTYYVVDLKVEFPDSAYLKSEQSQKFNTTLLKNSTYKFNRVKFDGPLPYQYVY